MLEHLFLLNNLGNHLKIIIITILFYTSLFADQLQIIADSFERNQQTGISSFKGHVRIKKNYDELNASKLFVYVDKDNSPTKYVASGNVSFDITNDNNASYLGRSQRLIFLPKEQIYHFYEKVYIEEKITGRTLSGEKVTLNMITGNSKILGQRKAPVRVTFEIDDKNSTKVGLNNKTEELNNTKSDSNTTHLPISKEEN